MPRHIRRIVLLRDDHKCRQCRGEDRLTVDHIKPLAHGGKNTLDNYQTLCYGCNQAKADSWSE